MDLKDDAWELHEILEEHTAFRELPPYSHVMREMEPPLSNDNEGHRHKFSQLLFDVLQYECNQGHPPLTAIVVAVATDEPYETYFQALRDLGMSMPIGKEDRHLYWAMQVGEVHDYWRKQLPAPRRRRTRRPSR